MPAAFAVSEPILLFSTAVLCAIVPKAVRYFGSIWLYASNCDCRCEPITPLYEASSTMLELSCRWMEKLKLLNMGGRVASLPWNQGMLSPFEKDGLIKGGIGYVGKPSSRIKDGVTLLPVGGLYVCVNPRWCVEPVTVEMAAVERA